MQEISLDRLHAHPDNANIMPEPRLAQLQQHIERSGKYPPLIVRPHPSFADAYELLDGHHRAKVLRQLGRATAVCIVWDDVDDDQAALLLATLNRLHGSDDPAQRGRLLARIADNLGIKQAAALLPDTREQIDRLIAVATQPPPNVAPPPAVDDLPHPVTFFLSSAQRERVLRRLAQIDPDDRAAALVQLVESPDG